MAAPIKTGPCIKVHLTITNLWWHVSPQAAEPLERIPPWPHTLMAVNHAPGTVRLHHRLFWHIDLRVRTNVTVRKKAQCHRNTLPHTRSHTKRKQINHLTKHLTENSNKMHFKWMSFDKTKWKPWRTYAKQNGTISFSSSVPRRPHKHAERADAKTESDSFTSWVACQTIESSTPLHPRQLSLSESFGTEAHCTLIKVWCALYR